MNECEKCEDPFKCEHYCWCYVHQERLKSVVGSGETSCSRRSEAEREEESGEEPPDLSDTNCSAIEVNKAELGALIDYNVRQYEFIDDYIERKMKPTAILTPDEKAGRFPVALRVRASKLRRRTSQLRMLMREFEQNITGQGVED